MYMVNLCSFREKIDVRRGFTVEISTLKFVSLSCYDTYVRFYIKFCKVLMYLYKKSLSWSYERETLKVYFVCVSLI